MKIVDEQGRELPWDGVCAGELKVRGPWVCSGYFRLDESAAHDVDGWFATGDVAAIDADGYLHITDRAKDVIKSGGEWISSVDMENCACGHPDVLMAAAIGVRHPKWEERPLLIVMPRQGRTPARDSVLAHSRSISRSGSFRTTSFSPKHPAHRDRKDRQEATTRAVPRSPDEGECRLTRKS